MTWFNQLWVTVGLLVVFQEEVWGGALDACEPPDQGVPLSGLPVCVVGGGITGLVIAHRLLRANKFVILLESAFDHVGGKMDTQISLGGYWEKGAVIFSAEDKYILELARELETDYIFWNQANIGFFNPEFLQTTNVTPVDKARLNALWASHKQGYTNAYNRYPRRLFGPRGFELVHTLTSTHPDLFLSAQQWLLVHGLGSLAPFFGLIFTPQGYGPLRDLPALYMLKYLHPNLATIFVGLLAGSRDVEQAGIYCFTNGTTDLAYRLAKGLKCAYLGNTVFQLWRAWQGNPALEMRIKVGADETIYTRFCSRVVLTFDPLIGKMVRLMPKLTAEDQDVLSAIRVHKFFASGNLVPEEIRPGNDNIYLGVWGREGLREPIEQGNGDPIALIRAGRRNNTDAYTFYSWIYGRYDAGPTDEDLTIVDSRLRGFMRALTKETSKLSFLEGYEHFPHVAPAHIREGWFVRCARLQGQGGLYFASTVSTFDSLNAATENAVAVADLVLASFGQQG